MTGIIKKISHLHLCLCLLEVEAFIARDLNPGNPHERWQSYNCTMTQLLLVWGASKKHDNEDYLAYLLAIWFT